MTGILFEDSELIVVIKPAGVPSQPDKTGDSDMLTMLSEYCGMPCYLIHRLDRPVAGIMVFAKNSPIASQLSQSNIKKQYSAIVCGNAPEDGKLEHYLLKNQRLNTSKAVNKNTPQSKAAVLQYKKLAQANIEPYGVLSKVLIDLLTGRHHQIRVQFSTIGLPLWGDTKYNPAFARTYGFVQIGLAACGLEFRHPSSGRVMSFFFEPDENEPFLFFK